MSNEAQAKSRSLSVPSWYADHDRAVQLAREGRYDEALPIFEALYQQHTKDVGVVRDYMAVLVWMGGHDAQAASLYESLPADQPDYVLEAAGRAYLNLHQPEKALDAYQIGFAREPGNADFTIGIMRSYADDGHIDSALQLANVDVQKNGERSEVLLVAAYLAERYGENDKAVDYYQAAARVEPSNKEAVQGLIRTEDQAGLPQLALKVADQNPGLIPPEEYRAIQGDEAAEIVRQSLSEPADKAQPRIAAKRALAHLNRLIKEWSQQGPEAREDILRVRFDRLLALHGANQMQDVITEYRNLLAEGVKIPPYALGVVADAYLYLHQPEKARDLDLQILKSEPNNYEAQRSLFYAYADSGDYDNAFRVVDGMVKDQQAAVDLKGEATPDPRLLGSKLMAGAARIYAGQIAEADKIITPAARTAPNLPVSHEALGNLAMAHGWPRAALQHYQQGSALAQGGDLGNNIGIASADLALQNFPAAEAKTQELDQQNPGNGAVQRADRDWEVHNMAEWRVRAGYAFQPETASNVTGGEGYGIDTVLYSSPIDYNWRIFAGEYFAHQTEPNAEGSISLSRSTAGVEYRNDNLTASLNPTYNHYKGTERLGGATEETYTVDDQWTLAGSGELFSRETPLRALNSGVTADFFNMHATWREDETRSVRFGGDIMPFSDRNLRTGLDTDYIQRVYTIPNFTIDGLGSLGESQNSDDENRYYYNPGADVMGLVGARAVQTLYQRYATLYQQSLRVTPGMYWQLNHGESAAVRALYEQRLFLANVFEAGMGVRFSRQAYDGVAENDVSLLFDLVRRF